jgi:hypothetical protein
VEIGQKATNDLEFVAGAEEDAGLAGMSRQGFTTGDLGAVLERTRCGGANGNDAIPRS